MGEKLMFGYEVIEAENIEASVNRYIATRSSDITMDIVSDDYDPRVVETMRNVEAAGFSMEKGQYYDLINK